MHTNQITAHCTKAPWTATQHALSAGAGRFSTTHVVDAMRWTRWPLHVPDGIERWNAHSVARCSDCGGLWSEHGWTGTEPICVGDWVLSGPAGVVVLKPDAFHAQYEAVQADEPL